jgi:hypothetical protein
MTCDEFLDRYSDFRDGSDSGPESGGADAFDAHLASCSQCRRYHDVIERGTSLLRENDAPALQDDFRDRLQHRIYHADLKLRTPSPRDLGMAAPVALGLAAAAALAAVAAWGPMAEAVRPLPTADLAPIAAEAPPSLRVRPVAGVPGGTRAPAALVQPDYWVQSHTLLYEHSSVYHRNRGGGMVRTGIQ